MSDKQCLTLPLYLVTLEVSLNFDKSAIICHLAESLSLWLWSKLSSAQVYWTVLVIWEASCRGQVVCHFRFLCEVLQVISFLFSYQLLYPFAFCALCVCAASCIISVTVLIFLSGFFSCSICYILCCIFSLFLVVTCGYLKMYNFVNLRLKTAWFY